MKSPLIGHPSESERFIMRNLFLILALCMPCSVFGQAKAVIEGPSEIQPGDLVILKSQGSTGKAFGWKLVNSDKTFLVFEDQCVFASGTPGDYIFVLGVLDEDAAGPSGDLAVHTLKVLGKVPVPPGPVDPVEPDDPKPAPKPSLTGVQLKMFNVLDRNKADLSEVQLVIDNISGVIGEAAGLGWSPSEINTKLGTMNREDVFKNEDAVQRWGQEWATIFIDIVKPFKDDRDETLSRLSEIEEGMRAYHDWASSSTSVYSASGQDHANESLADVLKGMRGSVEKLKGDLRSIRQEVGQ